MGSSEGGGVSIIVQADPTWGLTIPRHQRFVRALTCSVGGLPATPQAGGFYGGWVTPGLAGPFKGEPGSENW
jgi:hypothetical protein